MSPPASAVRDAPRLAWALVEMPPPIAAAVRETSGRPGAAALRLTALSDYAHLRPAARPPAFCPVCREPVWMKLGPRNRHHYAHAAERSTCAATTPEGALHLAAKLHLARLLETLPALRIARLCHRAPSDLAHPCRTVDTRDWIDGWDEVRVEYAIPSLRADLMLLRAGVPLAAIEVCATHAVDALRSARYRDLGIPWIEVPAARVTDLYRPLWTGDAPLPVQADSAAEPWRCPRHARLHAAWMEHQRSGTHRLAGRFVHLYRTDGGLAASEQRVDRILVAMYERREEGACVEAWLVREDRDTPLGAPVRTSDREEAMRVLHERFVDWVQWTRKRGVVVDSPMRWLPAAALPLATSQRDLDTLFPERARWDAQTRTFLLPPNAPSLAWPAMPAAPEDDGDALGPLECFWTALPERDRPPLTHARVGPLWATLQVDRWTDPEGAARSRATIDLHRHDGARWVAEPAPEGNDELRITNYLAALAGGGGTPPAPPSNS